MHLDIKEFEYFKVVCEQKSITRAAGYLYMNQQTMYKDGTVYENGVSSDSPNVGVRAAVWISLRQKEGDSNLF